MADASLMVAAFGSGSINVCFETGESLCHLPVALAVQSKPVSWYLKVYVQATWIVFQKRQTTNVYMSSAAMINHLPPFLQRLAGVVWVQMPVLTRNQEYKCSWSSVALFFSALSVFSRNKLSVLKDVRLFNKIMLKLCMCEYNNQPMAMLIFGLKRVHLIYTTKIPAIKVDSGWRGIAVINNAWYDELVCPSLHKTLNGFQGKFESPKRNENYLRQQWREADYTVSNSCPYWPLTLSSH